MWEPYKAVAKEAFPNCIVAVDELCKALHNSSYVK